MSLCKGSLRISSSARSAMVPGLKRWAFFTPPVAEPASEPASEPPPEPDPEDDEDDELELELELDLEPEPEPEPAPAPEPDPLPPNPRPIPAPSPTPIPPRSKPKSFLATRLSDPKAKVKTSKVTRPSDFTPAIVKGPSTIEGVQNCAIATEEKEQEILLDQEYLASGYEDRKHNINLRKNPIKPHSLKGSSKGSPMNSIRAMIWGLNEAGEFMSCRKCYFQEVYALLEEMRGTGCEPDAKTYNSILESLLENGETAEACSLLEDMLEKGIILNIGRFEIEEKLKWAMGWVG
ncbi:hypothetical protein RJ639_006170 [Escallonia herrerae]|uniref:Pentatricopeptide repeat-containing protein n=1 Tax=Escallonia herrerae TaxID=1293975 RepID=A0AA89AZS0_9ASTE|nr:hypothetical protein RJ639_006170 [Escallonia herrerae]